MGGLTNKIYLATLEVSCLSLHFIETTLLVSTAGGIMEKKCKEQS